MALIMRLLRSQLLNVLGEEYIQTARAKGLSERIVVYKHALRNALLPVVTVIGLQLGVLLGGAVITETVFSIPGLGRLLIQGIYNRDMAVVQAGVFIFALGIVLVNLLTDIVYTILDPRISYQ
jgi:peptide/nickel transport system permease protein